MTFAEIQQRREANVESRSESTPVMPKPGAAIRAGTNNGQPIGYLADATLQLDRSMVGLPFEMSGSVVDQCERWQHWCDELDKFLARMAGEPRDPAWAPQVEQFIVKQLAVTERNALRIRALECRSTRCALEVASESQSGVRHEGLWNYGNLDLEWDGASAVGWELDPSTGVQTYVEVETWIRRSSDD
jgi:hypothetical protein